MIKELKAGRVEFRVDKTANLHVPIGKASFSADNLTENFAALMEAVKKAKPPAAKGTYLRKITVTSTMGPGDQDRPEHRCKVRGQRFVHPARRDVSDNLLRPRPQVSR